MKNTFRHFAFVLGSVVLVSNALHASVGTEGAAFLNIPVGAGPAALGGAYSALAHDAYAPVYNPAGLGFMNSVQVAGQHLDYLDTLKYEFASFGVPLNKGKTGVGASIQYLGTGDIDGLELDGTTRRQYSSYYAAYNVAVGHALSEKVSVGLTGKAITGKLDDTSAKAFAADLGAMVRPSKALTVSGTVTNLGNKLKFIDEGDSLPMAVHLGAAYKPHRQWMVTGEGVYRKTGLASAHAGAEWTPLQILSLRAGYKTDTLKELSALAGFTTGVGLKMWGQELAYAWVPYGELGDTHYISLLMKFGEAEEAKRNLIQYQKIKKHRMAGGHAREASETEYDQLMQLLSHDELHVADERTGVSSRQ